MPGFEISHEHCTHASNGNARRKCREKRRQEKAIPYGDKRIHLNRDQISGEKLADGTDGKEAVIQIRCQLQDEAVVGAIISYPNGMSSEDVARLLLRMAYQASQGTLEDMIAR
jgi:hypothetical protein